MLIKLHSNYIYPKQALLISLSSSAVYNGKKSLWKITYTISKGRYKKKEKVEETTEWLLDNNNIIEL